MEGVMHEIELKAHITSIEPCLRRLLQRYPQALSEPYHKKDTYFRHPDLEQKASEFRLRITSDGTALVTRKERRMEGSVEVNAEIEFTVSDERAFIAFTESLGYQVWQVKEKRGVSVMIEDGVTVELVEVTGLGCFAEIELLQSDGRETGPAKERLYALLEELGIDSGQVEPRYYTQMLAEQKRP